MKPHPPGAVASLVFGIFAILTGGIPLLGIILGTLATLQAKRAVHSQQLQVDAYQATGLPIAGYVTGIIGIVLSVLATLWMFFVLGLMGMIIAAVSSIETAPVEPLLRW